MAYFNGENWIAVDSLVDTKKGTVTVAANSFPGEIVTIVVVSTIMVGAVAAGGYKAYQYFAGDPISNKKASTYVTPDNPTVADYTERAAPIPIKTAKRSGSQWKTRQMPESSIRVS